MEHAVNAADTPQTTKIRQEKGQKKQVHFSITLLFSILAVVFPLLCVLTGVLVHKQLLHVYAPEIIVRLGALEFVCIVILALLRRDSKTS